MGLLSCVGRFLSTVLFWLSSPLRWLRIIKKKKVDNDLLQFTRTADGGKADKGGDDDGEWQEWGAGDSFTVDIDPASKPRLPANMHQHVAETVSQMNASNEGEVEEINLFEDMQPTFRRAKKITVRTSTSDATDEDSGKLSSRLAMESLPQTSSSELGTWNENVSTWEDETGIDENELTWTAKNSMREKREADRIRRQAEIERKRHERESQRQHRMLGTKLDS
ncbi:receptor-binding cancer antigen expressed on SiSo cells-like [Corticium candelabrum]|uniref:receptor-binding cancer antigen expressed on SiSo cells-like n=1 Tax=Corticium candelabrum TaxID=121492 RepID=UPI002E258148|nr:receptor-binding cancer antigen expressed on SiSo cells-like [Corticium candelabrum]